MNVTKDYRLPFVYSAKVTKTCHTEKYLVCHTTPFERLSNYPESAYFKKFRRVHIYFPKSLYANWEKMLKYGLDALIKIPGYRNYSKHEKGVLCCYATKPLTVKWHIDHRKQALNVRKKFNTEKEKELLEKLFKNEDAEYIEWLENKMKEEPNY